MPGSQLKGGSYPAGPGSTSWSSTKRGPPDLRAQSSAHVSVKVVGRWLSRGSAATSSPSRLACSAATIPASAQSPAAADQVVAALGDGDAGCVRRFTS